MEVYQPPAVDKATLDALCATLVDYLNTPQRRTAAIVSLVVDVVCGPIEKNLVSATEVGRIIARLRRTRMFDRYAQLVDDLSRVTVSCWAVDGSIRGGVPYEHVVASYLRSRWDGTMETIVLTVDMFPVGDQKGSTIAASLHALLESLGVAQTHRVIVACDHALSNIGRKKGAASLLVKTHKRRVLAVSGCDAHAANLLLNRFDKVCGTLRACFHMKAGCPQYWFARAVQKAFGKHGVSVMGNFECPSQLTWQLIVHVRAIVGRRAALGLSTFGLLMPAEPLDTRWSTLHLAVCFILVNDHAVAKLLEAEIADKSASSDTSVALLAALGDPAKMFRLALFFDYSLYANDELKATIASCHRGTEMTLVLSSRWLKLRILIDAAEQLLHAVGRPNAAVDKASVLWPNAFNRRQGVPLQVQSDVLKRVVTACLYALIEGIKLQRAWMELPLMEQALLFQPSDERCRAVFVNFLQCVVGKPMTSPDLVDTSLSDAASTAKWTCANRRYARWRLAIIEGETAPDPDPGDVPERLPIMTNTQPVEKRFHGLSMAMAGKPRVRGRLAGQIVVDGSDREHTFDKDHGIDDLRSAFSAIKAVLDTNARSSTDGE